MLAPCRRMLGALRSGGALPANTFGGKLLEPSAVKRAFFTLPITSFSAKRLCHCLAQSDGQLPCAKTFCPNTGDDESFVCPLAEAGLPEPRLNHLLDDQVSKRPLKGARAYKALLVDAAGTLIVNSQSTAQVYHQIGQKFGVKYTQKEIAAKYRLAYGHPWCRYRLRYEEDGRLYWQNVVEQATGCKDPAFLDALYEYYNTDKAWHIGDPEAEKTLKAIRAAGIKLAVVSNFDTRLRPLMRVLHCYDWFDKIVISAEVGVEKPNPDIFRVACEALGVKPEEVLHVGDDKTNDIVGASAAGCDSLLWGEEVACFGEVAEKLGVSLGAGKEGSLERFCYGSNCL